MICPSFSVNSKGIFPVGEMQTHTFQTLQVFAAESKLQNLAGSALLSSLSGCQNSASFVWVAAQVNINKLKRDSFVQTNAMAS